MAETIEDVYKRQGYMDVIRDSIESRANEVCREPEELNPMVALDTGRPPMP